MSTKQMGAADGDSHKRWHFQRHISSRQHGVYDEWCATAAPELTPAQPWRYSPDTYLGRWGATGSQAG